MAKKYDVCVKTGTYEVNGETKGRYLNVGAVLENENGPYLLLNRTFNPAGVGEGESVILSLFEPKGQKDDPRYPKSAGTPPQDDLNDSIPF